MFVIPRDPPIPPRQDGRAGTFNFQDRVALWFGMALCDNQSAPEFTHAPCTPNSDSNIFDGSDPPSPTTSAGTPAPPSWSCSSTRPAGRRSGRWDQL